MVVAKGLLAALLALFVVGQPAMAQQQAQDAQAADGEVMYMPPMRGAPQRRIGAGSRGDEDRLPSVIVFAPDHVGLTVSEHPTLYWYISGPAQVRVELTLIDEKQVAPIVEIPVPALEGAGVQRLRLADLNTSLRPEVEYQWTVALVPDVRERSNDTISGGVIKRIAPPKGLRERVAGASRDARPRLLAAAGLWYDALAEVSDLIEANPGNAALREQRARLLDQIGLPDAAAFDRRPR